MILSNEFTCSNGHKFTANAKSHSRCPECGKMARRFSKPNIVESVVGSDTGGDNTVLPPVNSPPPTIDSHNQITILKQGRPRVMAGKRPTPPRGPDGHFISSKKVAAKTKTVARRTTSTAKASVAKKGLVKHKVVRATGVTPTVRGRPPKTAVARHINKGYGSYAEEVMAKYGR